MACGEAGDDVMARRKEGDDVMACGEPRHGELLTSLGNLLQDQDFADLRLRLEDGEEVCSRLLVAAVSPVFRRMLANPMRERNQGQVVLEHVSKASWNVVVSFYFRGENLVTADNAEEIAEIACMYDMKSLAHHGSKVLSETVTTDTLFSRLELANKHDFQDARSGMLRFLGKHFETLRSTEKFNKLSQEDLSDVLGHHPLSVTTEDNVCTALLSWLEQNQVDEDAAVQLFDQVRLQDVSTEYISEQVMYHPQVVSSQTLRNRVAKEFRRRCTSTPASKKLFERPPSNSCNILLLGHDDRGMRVFGSREPLDEWRELPANEKVSKRFAACMLDGSVHVTGGEEAMKSTFVFDIERKIWSRGPDLLEGRRSHSMISLGQSVFVVAGFDGSFDLSSVEELGLSKSSWVHVGNLKVATALCGLAAVKNTILVAGGFKSDQTIQTFDTITSAAAILATTLPKSLKRTQGTQSEDEAVFLGEDGDLVRIKFSGGETPTVKHTLLRGFGQRGLFGLLVDSHVRVFGGSDCIRPGKAVDRFNLDGEKDEWRAAVLPVPLTVKGVFRTSLSCL